MCRQDGGCCFERLKGVPCAVLCWNQAQGWTPCTSLVPYVRTIVPLLISTSNFGCKGQQSRVGFYSWKCSKHLLPLKRYWYLNDIRVRLSICLTVSFKQVIGLQGHWPGLCIGVNVYSSAILGASLGLSLDECAASDALRQTDCSESLLETD